jgi:hypothetical protein
LTRILEQPELVRTVQSLEPRALGRLIEHIGLEDAGEIVALVTVDQLQNILDEDVWSAARLGDAEQFDPDRFALWLEVLLEAGAERVAEKIVELPEELVALAFHRQLIVIDIDELALEMSAVGESPENDLLEKALDSTLYHEIGEYRVIARRHRGWDAFVDLLCALDQGHHGYFQRLLERCAAASRTDLEAQGGLYSVLTSEEMLESDAAAEREDRRATDGFVPPQDAVAFLKLARATPLEQLLAPSERDPITRAYFRRFGAAQFQQTAAAKIQPPDSLSRLLQEAGIPTSPLRQLAESRPSENIFLRALLALSERDPDSEVQRRAELTYVANVLVAACSFRGQRFRPFEAARAVLATCNLGMERVLSGRVGDVRLASQLLVERCAEQLFSIGWHVLYQQVSLPAGHALTQKLANYPEAEPVHRAMQSALAAGRPWSVRHRLADLAQELGEKAVSSLKALLDEYPHLPQRDTGDSFIATAADLSRAHALIDELA